LHGIIGYQKVLQVVQRRGHGRDVVEGLLDRDVRDRTFFDDAPEVENLAAQLTTPLRDVTVVRDEEHNTHALRVDDRALGYSRVNTIGIEFVQSGEYRTLLASYADIKDIVRSFRRSPLEVRVQSGAPAPVEEPVDETGETAEGDQVQAALLPPRKESGPAFIATLDEMVEHFLALGRKGVAVNRYKGLGEMNPETLWATTMNPDTRTLLQVRAEDHTEADQMFTTLMGDQVEPRRKFIEDNALDVRNLDI
jgi:DNA gyrase subunit B